MNESCRYSDNMAHEKSSGLNQLVVRFNKPRLNAEINISAATRTSEGVLFNVRIEYQIKLFASFNKEMIDCGFIEKEGLKLVPMRDYVTGLFKPDENGSFPLYEKGKKEVETPFAVMYFSNITTCERKMCKKICIPTITRVKKFGQFINENYDDQNHELLFKNKPTDHRGKILNLGRT